MAGILAVTLTDAIRSVVDARPPDVPILVDPADTVGTGPSMNQRGAEMVAMPVLELGHRKVGLVTGSAGWLSARSRAERFVDVIQQGHGEVVSFEKGDWSAASGFEAALKFDTADGITAVFESNDAVAVGFIHGLIERGIGVPEDLSLAGFDDIPEAAFMNPALATVRPDYEGQGRSAMETLLADIEGRPRQSLRRPSGALIVRASTARRDVKSKGA